MAGGRYGWLPPAVFTGAASPLVVLTVRAALGQLSADPVAYVLNQLGLLALIFLVASLACTPARLLFGWGWAALLRRQLGLWGFAYAALHLCVYVLVDHGGDVRVVIEDVLRRPFITLGMAAFVCLVPLALTSTAKSVKRLGAKRWRRLHLLAYLAAALGVGHFVLRVKADVTEPALYGAVLAFLLGVRVVDWMKGRRRAS